MSENNSPARPGQRIVTPIPIVIKIEWNELTGTVDMNVTRDVPFPALVMIFCKILTQVIEQLAKAPTMAQTPT